MFRFYTKQIKQIKNRFSSKSNNLLKEYNLIVSKIDSIAFDLFLNKQTPMIYHERFFDFFENCQALNFTTI